MDMLKFLTIVGKLKKIKRAGWLRKNIANAECVSGHMYRMAVMAMVMPADGLKKDHCIKMCLVHDMAESIVGDITPHDNVSVEEKHKLELNAMKELCGLLGGKAKEEVMSLFMEYENQETIEARFVKDLDKFDMILQADHYEEEAGEIGKLQEFFSSVEGKLENSLVQDLAKVLNEKRKPIEDEG